MLRNQYRGCLDSFKQMVGKVGYEVVEPIKVLDAKEFGVPQRRRRAFVIGFKRNLSEPSGPEPTSQTDDNCKLTPVVLDAIGDLPEVSYYDELLANDRYYGELGKSSSYAKLLRENTNGKGLGGCLRTEHRLETVRRFEITSPGTCEKISRLQRLAPDGLAPTLRAGTGPNRGSFTAARPIHPFSPRCITTREAARLHSFPDWFEFHPTKWHGFRQVGNSVPPFLARAVAKKLFEAVSSLS